MSSKLFKQIVHNILNYNIELIPEYFQIFKQRTDCTGWLSINAIMKYMFAIRQLTYGTSPDAFDEYLQIGEHCSRDCLQSFTKCVYALYLGRKMHHTMKEIQRSL